MQETIDIIIRDKIDASISSNLKAIEANALAADKNVNALATSLTRVSGTQLNATAAAANSAAQAIMKAAQAQTASVTAASQMATAQSNAATATQRLYTEQMRTAEAAARAAGANTNAATAAQKLATEQNRTATTAAQAAAAKDRAAVAAQKLASSNAQAAQSALQAANAATAAATANAKQAASANSAAAANQKNATAMKGAASASSFFAKAGAAIGSALGAGEIIKMADAYTTMQNKLQNVATSQEQVNELTDRLFKLANETRSSVESTTTSFTRFDRSLKMMGKSQEETFRMTETINKALIVSGATAKEAASAQLQLSQAFNSGKLNGDEFRAVSENMPSVLDAVAKVMGKPISAMKELGSQGKITPKILFEAFKLMEKQIDATFAKTVPTTSQALTVLKNSATQFFGELDKKLGITRAMASAIIVLSKNLDVLAVAAVAVGAAMLVAFGPTIVAAIGAAAMAVKGFTLALLANPIGLVVAAIATLGFAFVMLGDKTSAGTKGMATLKDVGVAAFDAISDVAKDTIRWWDEYFTTADSSNKKVLASTMECVDESKGLWGSLFDTQYTGWAKAAIVAARFMDGLIGSAIFATRYIGNLFDMIWDRTAAVGAGLKAVMEGPAAMQKAFDDRLKNATFADSGAAYKKAMEDTLATVSTRGLESKMNLVFEKADLEASKRERSAKKGSNLRGKGKNELGEDVDKKAKKAAEDRAKAMDMVNLKLNDEMRRLTMLQPLREREEKFDQIKEQLAQKNIELSDSEAESIRKKIQAIQEGTKVQAEMDRMYQEAVGPVETYNAAVKAGNLLLEQGAISRAQYDQQMAKSAEAHANALDPMRQEMQALKDQQTLLTFLPKQREIETKMMELQTKISTGEIRATPEQVKAYREELLVLQQKNAIDTEKNALMENSVYAREKYINQLKAIKELEGDPKSGFTKGDSAQAVNGMLGGMGLDTSTMQVDMDAKLAMYSNYYSQLDAMRAAELISEQDYANAKAQIAMQEFRTKTAAAEQFFSGLAQLQGSNIKAFAKMGKAAAITQAIINTYEGATKALAQGGIYGSVMAAVVVAQGLSQVAAIRAQGYKGGGYTGPGPAGMAAGEVHKNEYVMTSPTTSRIGVADLDALQHGRAQIVRNNQNAGSATAGTVAQQVASSGSTNSGTSQPTQLTVINTLDPAMVGDFMNTPAGQEVLINAIRRNGDIIKSVVN